MKNLFMVKFQNKNQSLLSIALVSVLCLSLFAGQVVAASGCSAACCTGSQMDGHGPQMAQIADDLPCPCCSTSFSCSIDRNIAPVTYAAVHHDCQRAVTPPFIDALSKSDARQATRNEWASPLTEPPTKIPIYIATLTLIR